MLFSGELIVYTGCIRAKPTQSSTWAFSLGNASITATRQTCYLMYLRHAIITFKSSEIFNHHIRILWDMQSSYSNPLRYSIIIFESSEICKHHIRILWYMQLSYSNHLRYSIIIFESSEIWCAAHNIPLIWSLHITFQFTVAKFSSWLRVERQVLWNGEKYDVT